LSTDGEASQVIEAASAGQKRNAAIVNCLHHLQQSMVRLLDSLQGYSKDIIQEMLQSLEVSGHSQSVSQLINRTAGWTVIQSRSVRVSRSDSQI